MAIKPGNGVEAKVDRCNAHGCTCVDGTFQLSREIPYTNTYILYAHTRHLADIKSLQHRLNNSSSNLNLLICCQLATSSSRVFDVRRLFPSTAAAIDHHYTGESESQCAWAFSCLYASELQRSCCKLAAFIDEC